MLLCDQKIEEGEFVRDVYEKVFKKYFFKL